MKWTRAGSIAGLIFGLATACGGEDGPTGPGPNGEPANVPGTDMWVDAGDGADHGLMQTLTLIDAQGTTLESLQIERNNSAMVNVQGVFADGATVVLTDQVMINSSDPTVVSVAMNGEMAELKALEVGTSELSGTIGDLAFTQAVTVTRTLQSVELTVTETPTLNAIGAVVAMAKYGDGTEEDVTAMASWSSSAPENIRVFDDLGRRGLIFGLRRDASTVSASYEGMTATVDIEIPCGLGDSTSILPGQVLPNASWAGATMYDLDGNSSKLPLSVEDMMCAPEFDGVRAFIFSANAGWCRPCHAWMQRTGAAETQLNDAGVMPVYLIGEDAQGNPAAATSEYADRLSSQHAGDAWSIRLGNAETQGAGPNGFVQAVNYTGGWPTLFVVDRYDMRVLSIGTTAGWDGEFENVAPSVDGVISIVDQAAGSGAGASKCAAGVDEALEPNDVLRIAAQVEAGTHTGGICKNDQDFYRVDIEGKWKVRVEFTNSEVDIDMYGWNPETDAVLILENRPVQSAFVARNYEELEFEGPATFVIQGKRDGFGAYTMTVETVE